MDRIYNRIAGQSLERLSGLSDGVFSIAMTLLVLDLRLPVTEEVHSEGDLWIKLVALAPRMLAYLMSFLTLGIFWLGQQTQLDQLEQGNRNLSWLHIGFLLTVSVIPFSTGLLAEFMDYRLALIIYWLNILLLGVWLFATWRYALRAGFVREDVPAEVRWAMERRIFVLQRMYALGAALCVISPYLSVAVIFVTQLYSALGLPLIGAIRAVSSRRR